MRTWAGLFRHVERMDPLDRRLIAERAEFDRWSAAAEQRVMADLARASKSRAKEIEARTGVVVKVAYQVAGLPLASFGGAHGVVSLAFQLNAVDLYATRQDGASPNIHFACQRAPTSSRFPVVMTLPGCIVVRAGRAGYRLLTLPERAPTTVDEVVLHAFALLFGTAESVRQARTPLPLPPSP